MRPSYRNCSSVISRAVCRTARRPGWFRCRVWLLPMLLLFSVPCGNFALGSEQRQNVSPSGFRMASTAFNEGHAIPIRYTCQGEDVSPPLRWAQPPRGTRSFALIAEDPDAPAGVWTHWVVYNLPAGVRAMPENVPKQDPLASGGRQGLNSFGHTGYGGPCPPPGHAHRYFFRLYALDTLLSLEPRAARQDVLDAAKGHILGETQLMGWFKRQAREPRSRPPNRM